MAIQNKAVRGRFWFLFLQLLILANFYHSTMAQDFFNWKLHTCKKLVHDAVLSNGIIWAATDGGLFAYRIQDSSFRSWTKAEGLSGNSLSSIAVDKKGYIWIGGTNGLINVINPVDYSIKSIYDIYNFNNIDKSINSFLIKGDSIFVSTDFGIVLVQANSYNIQDSFLKFGNFPSKTRVRSCFLRDTIMYVATDIGIAVQKTGSTNLAAPESWTNFDQTSGLISNSVYKFARFGDAFIVSTNQGFSKFTQTGFDTFLPVYNGIDINDFTVKGDSLLILSRNKLSVYYNSVLSDIYNISDAQATKIISTNPDGYFCTDNGVSYFNNNLNKGSLYPNGPFANLLVNLVVDNKGSLWCSTGKDGKGRGAFQYDGVTWKEYKKSNVALFPTDDVYDVYAGTDGAIYMGTWGSGYYKFKPPNDFTRYSTFNTPFRGVPGDTLYLVVRGFRQDSKGNLWVLNFWPSDLKILGCMTLGNKWFTYPNYCDSSLTLYTNLWIDQFDTKWFVVNAALYYFNENGSFLNTANFKYGFLSSIPDLSGASVFDLVTDKRGELWIATSRGVYVLSDPSDVLNYSLSNVHLNSIFSIRQYSITCMAVDALNRKWIGTNDRLLLVSPDGTEILQTFTSKNSPMSSDKIISLAVDDITGKVYVGLEDAIAELSTYAVKPSEDFSGLMVYPSPYILSENSDKLKIRGLIKESQIKILDISGNEVCSSSTPNVESPGGNIATWNGRNNSNALVNSGVYIIIGFDKDGTTVGMKKVAVIRK